VKRLITLALACTIFLSVGARVAAQDADDDAGFYARSFFVHRIFPNQRGYRVQYWTDSGAPAETFLPIEWFRQAGGRGVFVEGNSPAYPFMQVFWRNGEFQHVRLHVRSNMSHESWGRWIAPDNVDELFDVEEPVLRL